MGMGSCGATPTDAETRDIARQMAGVQMLIPDERVWGNATILQLQGATDLAAAPLAGGAGGRPPAAAGKRCAGSGRGRGARQRRRRRDRGSRSARRGMAQ